jgi:hypothetical protein
MRRSPFRSVALHLVAVDRFDPLDDRALVARPPSSSISNDADIVLVCTQAVRLTR